MIHLHLRIHWLIQFKASHISNWILYLGSIQYTGSSIYSVQFMYLYESWTQKIKYLVCFFWNTLFIKSKPVSQKEAHISLIVLLKKICAYFCLNQFVGKHKTWFAHFYCTHWTRNICMFQQKWKLACFKLHNVHSQNVMLY